MSQVIRPVRQVFLGLSVVAALGFGVTSALAEAAQPAREVCTFLNEWEQCLGCCRGQGFTSGVVNNNLCQCHM